MKRLLMMVALGITTGIAPIQLMAESEPSCELRVTRVRNADHMDCYLRLGPKSKTFSHTNETQLEALSECIEKVDREYKLARYVCDNGYTSLPPLVEKQYDLPAVLSHYKFL